MSEDNVDVQDNTDLTTRLGPHKKYQKLVAACFKDDEVGNLTWEAAKALTYVEFLDTYTKNKPNRLGPLKLWVAHYGLENRFKQPEPNVPSFEEVPPLNLSRDTVLLDRDNSANLLCDVLLGTGGNLVTPVLDQCFGAGKTSLVWKFRTLASTTYSNSDGFPTLLDATYLSVRFQATAFSPLESEAEEQFKASAERMICKTIVMALAISSKSMFPPASNMHDLCQSLIGQAGDKKFLFHFDEIGCFESTLCAVRGRKILYCIWNAAECLRACGHFFVLSGRSRYLHSIGKQYSHDLGNDYASPNATRLIPLDTLSPESVKAVFVANGATTWIEKDGNLNAIRILTGGVPRAVFYAAAFLKSNENALPSDDQLKNHVKTNCPSMFTTNDDDIFRHLVEMSWAGMDVDVNAVVVGNELLSAMLTRFGLYTSTGSQSDRRVIEVPLYLSMCQHWTPGSLRSIAQYSEPGDRLETGFRRVLFPRMSVVDATDWKGIRLAHLDTVGVPFLLDQNTTEIFNFPKLAGSARGDAETAKAFMKLTHSRGSAEDRGEIQPERQVFSPKLLKHLAGLMQIGHFYLPLPRSSSADAMMRIGETVKLDWQFKNFQNPISEKAMKDEATLCQIAGWTVYLVIFCTAGHSANQDGSDFKFEHKGVTIIALSRQSVSNFLGHKLLDGIKSTGLASDQAIRLQACTSPLKRKYKNPSEVNYQMDTFEAYY